MSSSATNGVDIAIQRLPHGADLALPAPATDASAGADLLAAVTDPVVLKPGERALIPTGIAIGLPAGFEAQVRPRSGLAAKHGVTILNSPGTIDADYRGEIGVILVNLGERAFTVSRGIASRNLSSPPSAGRNGWKLIAWTKPNAAAAVSVPPEREDREC